MERIVKRMQTKQESLETDQLNSRQATSSHVLSTNEKHSLTLTLENSGIQTRLD